LKNREEQFIREASLWVIHKKGKVSKCLYGEGPLPSIRI
jgi:hypothetical protein